MKIFKFFRPRAKLQQYPNPLTMDEICNIFQDQGEANKIWQALDTIINGVLLDAINEVADPKNTQIQLSHASGRVDALSQLKFKLEECKQWKNGKTDYKLK